LRKRRLERRERRLSAEKGAGGQDSMPLGRFVLVHRWQ